MRVQSQPAYVLHARPYRETSLIVEVFSRQYGRLGMVAKGARNPKSRLRPLLLPFQPLLLSWSGKGELLLLTAVEATGPACELTGRGRYAGFYLNELIIRLLHRYDAHEDLFDRYMEVLASMYREDAIQESLRIFEKHLLTETGYGLILDRDAATGDPLDPDKLYRYVPEHGPELCQGGNQGGMCIHGSSLLDLDRGFFSNGRSRYESRKLIGFLLERQFSGRVLRSRQIFHQVLSRLENRP